MRMPILLPEKRYNSLDIPREKRTHDQSSRALEEKKEELGAAVARSLARRAALWLERSRGDFSTQCENGPRYF